VPLGVPIYILTLVVGIEIISFLTRPLSHSVRLFANMLAGHITLKVFASFVACSARLDGYFALPVVVVAGTPLLASRRSWRLARRSSRRSWRLARRSWRRSIPAV
jgi:F0F1-type ATP synthase membrane subunit a